MYVLVYSVFGLLKNDKLILADADNTPRSTAPVRPFNCCDARPPTSSPGRTEPKTTRFGASRSSVYTRLVSVIMDELKQRLIEVWSGLQQNIVGAAIGEWRKLYCKLVFVHMGDIANIRCRTIEKGIRNLKNFIFSRLTVFIEV